MNSTTYSTTKDFAVFIVLHMAKSCLGFFFSIAQMFYHFMKPNSIVTAKHISELRKTGLVKIDNFFSKSECDLIASEISTVSSLDFKSSAHESDLRLFNAEKSISSLQNFYANRMILNIGCCYLGIPIRNSGTMANIVPSGSSEYGSGGSWHRDSNFPQFKALLYLSDVDQVEDGAFQYIQGSNRFAHIFYESLRSKRSISNTRWTSEELAKNYTEFPSSVIGKAGTLVLFDTSLLHRGAPNTNGFRKMRIAITNYYYPLYGSIGAAYAK